MSCYLKVTGSIPPVCTSKCPGCYSIFLPDPSLVYICSSPAGFLFWPSSLAVCVLSGCFWPAMQFYVHSVQSACSWESTNISCGGFSSVKCYINVRGWISKEMLAATWETGRIYTTAGLISTWRSCFWCLGIFLITQKNLKQFSVFSWRMKETSQGLWYILCLNEQNRHYSRGERENVHFLQHDDTEADFFQRCVLQNGLKCKAFKCKSMAFVFTWSTHILYNSTTMFRRTETTSSTIFDTQF